MDHGCQQEIKPISGYCSVKFTLQHLSQFCGENIKKAVAQINGVPLCHFQRQTLVRKYNFKYLEQGIFLALPLKFLNVKVVLGRFTRWHVKVGFSFGTYTNNLKCLLSLDSFFPTYSK